MVDNNQTNGSQGKLLNINPYTTIPNKLILSKINPYAIVIMSYLIHNRKDFKPSFATIAKMTGIERRIVGEQVEALFACGMVEMIKPEKKGQRSKVWPVKNESLWDIARFDQAQKDARKTSAARYKKARERKKQAFSTPTDLECSTPTKLECSTPTIITKTNTNYISDNRLNELIDILKSPLELCSSQVLGNLNNKSGKEAVVSVLKKICPQNAEDWDKLEDSQLERILKILLVEKEKNIASSVVEKPSQASQQQPKLPALRKKKRVQKGPMRGQVTKDEADCIAQMMKQVFSIEREDYLFLLSHFKKAAGLCDYAYVGELLQFLHEKLEAGARLTTTDFLQDQEYLTFEKEAFHRYEQRNFDFI